MKGWRGVRAGWWLSPNPSPAGLRILRANMENKNEKRSPGRPKSPRFYPREKLISTGVWATLKPAEKDLVTILDDRTNRTTGACFPSTAYICLKSGRRRNSIRLARHSLRGFVFDYEPGKINRSGHPVYHYIWANNPISPRRKRALLEPPSELFSEYSDKFQGEQGSFSSPIGLLNDPLSPLIPLDREERVGTHPGPDAPRNTESDSASDKASEPPRPEAGSDQDSEASSRPPLPISDEALLTLASEKGWPAVREMLKQSNRPVPQWLLDEEKGEGK
jgi:hypothetical protein